MRPATREFPPNAPRVPRPGVPGLYRPVVLERHLFPSVAEAVGLLLGIPVGFIPGSVVAAPWTAAALAAGGWAVARLTVNLDKAKLLAFLIQPLEVALEWGAIGLPRPPAGREPPRFDRTGRLDLTETNRQDLMAYAEICNVVACGVLARSWEEQLAESLFVLLEEVVGADGGGLPEGLQADGFVAVQGLFGYQERPASPKAGPADYERQTPWLLVMPEGLAVQAIWRATDGTGRGKTAWLVQTGRWRRLPGK